MIRSNACLLLAVLALACCLLPGNAAAYTSGHVQITTTNLYRGLDLTRGPGVRGGIDYEHVSGFQLGLSTMNLEQGNRATLQTGYGMRSLNWGYDLGVVYHTFSESGEIEAGVDIDYAEIYGVLALGPINLSAWGAPNMLNSEQSAWFVEADYTWRGRTGVGLELNVGVATGSYYDLAREARPDGLLYAGQAGGRVTGGYFTWGARLTRTMRDFTWSLGLAGTDRGNIDSEGTSDRVKWVLGLERRFDF